MKTDGIAKDRVERELEIEAFIKRLQHTGTFALERGGVTNNFMLAAASNSSPENVRKTMFRRVDGTSLPCHEAGGASWTTVEILHEWVTRQAKPRGRDARKVRRDTCDTNGDALA